MFASGGLLMKRFLSREFLAVFLPAVLIAVAAFWFAGRYVKPAPPKSFVLSAASKGSPYYELAARYREEIAKLGVTVDVRESQGSFDNLKGLKDPNSDVQAGIVQGGLANSLDAQNIHSMGRLLTEPVWIFYRGPDALDHITQLKGKRILIGPEGSGTGYLARKLLDANGVTAREFNADLDTAAGLCGHLCKGRCRRGLSRAGHGRANRAKVAAPARHKPHEHGASRCLDPTLSLSQSRHVASGRGRLLAEYPGDAIRHSSQRGPCCSFATTFIQPYWRCWRKPCIRFRAVPCLPKMASPSCSRWEMTRFRWTLNFRCLPMPYGSTNPGRPSSKGFCRSGLQRCSTALSSSSFPLSVLSFRSSGSCLRCIIGACGGASSIGTVS